MALLKFQKWGVLSYRERTISLFVLILLWGGIAVAILLGSFNLIQDPGTFFWGEILGSLLIAYLAALKKKKDIVALMTPLYAIIIFTGLEIKPNLLLQVLFAASGTVILYRLLTKFSEENYDHRGKKKI